jgi:LuxR family maltose regulon positive regulatory protein
MDTASLPRFARTKIQPPRLRAATLIARPVLEPRLRDALLTQRLVLVCAAAGYGKTAALARQLETLPAGTAAAWITAEEGDDLHRLLECLVCALEPFDLPWRTAPEALVAAAGSAAQRKAVAAELVNTLDACDVPHGAIVIDDLDRIDDAAIFEFLDLLLQRLSPRWTLTVASRSEPPLALARLRALGEIAEFRQADLAFDTSEVHALVAASGLPVEIAEPLHRRTQGWPAGLRLVLNAQRGGSSPVGPAAIDRQVFEFLAAEVLDRQQPELREFLLRSAVLPELSANRCAAVTGNPRSAYWLEEIERQGLFVSVLQQADPTAPLTLRLHGLFRDALEHRLSRERPDEVPALLQRAAAGETDPVRRIGLLLRAGDLDEAARVLLQCSPAMLTEGALAGVARLIDQFPPDWAAQSPLLHRVRGLLAWARWNFVVMVDAMQQAHERYRACGDEDGAQATAAYQSIALTALGRIDQSAPRLASLRREKLSLETRVVVLVACMWHAMDVGSTHRVGPLLEELLGLVEHSTDLALWYRSYPIARVNGLPGTARALDRWVECVLRLTEGRSSQLRALAFAQRGWREAWAGRLDAALESLQLAVADAQWIGNPPNVRGFLKLLEASLHALRGDAEAALAAARQCIDDHPPGRGPWSLWGVLLYAARVAGACEALPDLRAHLGRLQALQGVNEAGPTRAPLLATVLGQLAWLEGRGDDAVALWQDALREEHLIDRLGLNVETRVRLAAAHLAADRIGDAAQVLGPVFPCVADHAGVGGVLFARSVLPELAAAPWGQRLRPDAQATLRLWLAQVASHTVPTAAAAPRTGAPAATTPADATGLSARERAVLARIAAGDSNKLIARAFDLSPHTVKRHVANILDKLGVQSRGQAAAWYRRQG